MKRILLLLGSLACLSSGGALAQELGRLFFTPEQRQALDARRKARIPDKPAAAAASPTLRLDGYVKRANGRSTVWVNGESTDDTARIPASTDGRLPVHVSETGARVGLKPGETLDRGNNEVRDVIGDGEIRVRRNPGAK
jgi:hypothetical protein